MSSVVLAPLEDVSDWVFRRLCRSVGAQLCFTEFVNVENLLNGDRNATRKVTLHPGDTPTAIQIYGANPQTLVEAARIAADASPVAIDINCGCWVPKIAGRGAGAAWLRDPDAMVAMAKQVVTAVNVPVTVKTRVAWDERASTTIPDLAVRLQDVGVKGITVHCRTAKMGHNGSADWSWAAKAQSKVKIPVTVNGDVRTAQDAKRALDETGCAAVMIGRRAVEHPWIFREARALIERGVTLAPPTNLERLQLAIDHLNASVAFRGERTGVKIMRRHYPGYLQTMPELRPLLNTTETLARTLDVLCAKKETEENFALGWGHEIDSSCGVVGQ